jgi:glycosyltransferase involved in cell wall biosynthesis
MRVIRVARRLKAVGIDTVVAMPKGDPRFSSLLDQAQIPFCETELVRLRSSLNPMEHARCCAKFWPNVVALCRLIQKHHIDVVHTNGLMNLQAAIAARMERAKLVWHLNDVVTPKALRALCLPFVLSWADRIAISSKAVGRYYFPKPRSAQSRVHVLYPPVDTEEFRPDADDSVARAVRREFGIRDGCPVIGTVANIAPGKGFEYLLEAAGNIKQAFPDTKFLFVGQRLANRQAYWGFLARRIKELALANDVYFAGGRSDISRLMRAMTLYVHPSESESCGMSILEASASGLPVVAADVDGPRETVVPNVTGMLVEPKHPLKFAEAIIRLLSDPETARRMGVAGAERMRALFSLDRCVKEHMCLYKALVPGKNRQYDLSFRHQAHRSNL